MSIANRALPNDVKLLNPAGTLASGSFKDIQIVGQRYPLACRYRRNGLSFSGVNYHLNCDAPFVVEGDIALTWGGDATLTDGLLSGNIQNATPWFSLLGMPMQASGDLNLAVAKAQVQNQSLTYLSVTGSSPQINVFFTPILKNLRIETLNASLSDSKPIQLEVRTEDVDNNNTQFVQLYATSQINGKNYQTNGEISGKKLKNYASVLRFFGRQTGYNQFTIQLQGTLFP